MTTSAPTPSTRSWNAQPALPKTEAAARAYFQANQAEIKKQITPHVLSAANGVVQVNIPRPSPAGVSRNTYRQFDVPANGVILNNARNNAGTQLGGQIQGNPWLATGTARVILNEVNSASPSQLRGYLEVGGDRAEVIIANPAGIVCGGCGFINVGRSTLSTGVPVLLDGRLEGFRVSGGLTRVGGAGLDARSCDYTRLIARALEINAGVWAQDLNVVAGAAHVPADGSPVTPVPGAGQAPAVCSDSGPRGSRTGEETFTPLRRHRVSHEHSPSKRHGTDALQESSDLPHARADDHRR